MIRGCALVLLAACLYGAAHPPIAAWPLAWVALAPLFAACVGAGPGRGLALGGLFGVSAAFVTSSWLPGMLQDFFEIGPVPAWSMTLAVYVCLAGSYFAAFGFALGWAGRRGPISPFVVALLFAGCELARAYWLVPDPWALIAYSQLPFTGIVQLADLAGPFGLGALIALVNACVAGVVVARLRPSPRAAFGVALIGLLALAYGQGRLATDFGVGEPERVALVQGGLDRSLRFQAERREANLAHHVALTRVAEAASADLVFWPEFAVDFPLHPAAAATASLWKAAREMPVDLIFGVPTLATQGGRGRYHNSALLVRDGHPVARYDKVRLMPFSESNPLRGLLDIGNDLYRPGVRIAPLESGSLRIGMLLCSEAMLPAFVRATSLAGATLLANPSNDDWFDDAGAAASQLAAVAFRAVENRRYLVRPAANGFTAVIDPHGRVIQRAARGRPEVLVASVRGSDTTTPYQRLGDRPLALASAFACLALVLRRRRESPPFPERKEESR